jgi:hypothetical protein
VTEDTKKDHNTPWKAILVAASSYCKCCPPSSLCPSACGRPNPLFPPIQTSEEGERGGRSSLCGWLLGNQALTHTHLRLLPSPRLTTQTLLSLPPATPPGAKSPWRRPATTDP